MTGSPFDALADDYAAARPGYPDELYDAVARLAGVTWTGARVVDVGAGTGIASGAMRARGAQVLAVDVGPGMLARLRADVPGTPAVLGRAEQLPLRDGVADLVSSAQAWHWVDVPRASAEAIRVLRPGGALAVWWNDAEARGERWWEEQHDRIEAGNPEFTREYRDVDYGAGLVETGRFASVEYWSGRWSRSLDLDTYERWLRSKSYVAALGPDLPAFLAAERASLLEAFPDGVVHEPFRVRLWVARTA